jgi:hypothetical protein
LKRHLRAQEEEEEEEEVQDEGAWYVDSQPSVVGLLSQNIPYTGTCNTHV